MGPATPRFLADGMLGRLCTWLRLLGFDTAYGRRASETVLLRRAAAEDRMLLTRNRRLLRRKRLPPYLYVEADDFRAQLARVVETFDLDPRATPFQRCSVCNQPLVALDRGARAAASRPTSTPPKRSSALPQVRPHLLARDPRRTHARRARGNAGAPDRRSGRAPKATPFPRRRQEVEGAWTHRPAPSSFSPTASRARARSSPTRSVSEDGSDELRCVHCDRPAAGPLCFAAGEDLPEHGYDFVEFGGCGNPNCGGGRCSRA